MIAYWLLAIGFYVVGYSVGYAIWGGGTEIKAVVNDAAEFAKTSPEPALKELYTDIYAEAS